MGRLASQDGDAGHHYEQEGRQLVLPPLRLHGLREEWKALWRDSDTVPGTGAGTGCAGLLDCPDVETVGRREESCM